MIMDKTNIANIDRLVATQKIIFCKIARCTNRNEWIQKSS